MQESYLIFRRARTRCDRQPSALALQIVLSRPHHRILLLPRRLTPAVDVLSNYNHALDQDSFYISHIVQGDMTENWPQDTNNASRPLTSRPDLYTSIEVGQDGIRMNTEDTPTTSTLHLQCQCARALYQSQLAINVSQSDVSKLRCQASGGLPSCSELCTSCLKHA